MNDARYLISYFGTLVYLDPATLTLHHGQIGHAPENITVSGPPDASVLQYEHAGTFAPVCDLGPGGCRYVPGDTASCTLELRRHGADRTTVHRSGRVMTAEVEGHVSFFRSTIDRWEVFLALTADELTELKFILLNSWAQAVPAKVFAPADIAVGEDFTICFGVCKVSAADVVRLLRGPVAARASNSLEIVTLFEGWKVLALRLYRPLVYLVAFGRPDIFESAELAIASLRTHGGPQCDVMVITDRQHGAASDYSFGHGVTTVVLQAEDIMDFALARYGIAEFACTHAYQPILYLDTDVVCNAPLDGLFRTLCFSDDLHVVPEGLLLDELDFYGRTLFQLDAGVGSDTDLGFSTGILAFRNTRHVQGLFRLILESTWEYARSAMTRDAFSAFDQPIANYVVRKNFPTPRSLEAWAVVSLYVKEPSYAPESRLGLIHFAGGVGNATPKIERMRQYLQRLDAAKLEDDA